jgi:hypothetical protein
MASMYSSSRPMGALHVMPRVVHTASSIKAVELPPVTTFLASGRINVINRRKEAARASSIDHIRTL